MPDLDPVDEPQSDAIAHQTKIEEQQQIQKTIDENQNAESKFTVKVRPWIPGDYIRKPDINLMTLLALFKCLHKTCTFATDNEVRWNQHIEQHLKVVDYLNVTLGQSWEKSERRENYMRFRDCPYCEDFHTKLNVDVTNHISGHHRGSNLQCRYCFYRCVELDNIALHLEEFHPDKPKEILLLDESREFIHSDLEQLGELCSHNLKKMKCGQGMN